MRTCTSAHRLTYTTCHLTDKQFLLSDYKVRNTGNSFLVQNTAQLFHPTLSRAATPPLLMTAAALTTTMTSQLYSIPGVAPPYNIPFVNFHPLLSPPPILSPFPPRSLHSNVSHSSEKKSSGSVCHIVKACPQTAALNELARPQHTMTTTRKANSHTLQGGKRPDNLPLLNQSSLASSSPLGTRLH